MKYPTFQYLSKLLLVLGVIAHSTQSTAAVEYDLVEQQQLVKTNQAKWNAALNSTGCAGAYVMTFQLDCRCLPEDTGPIQAVVNSTGEIASAVYLYNIDRSEDLAGKPVKLKPWNVMTVKGAFNVVKRALNVKANSVEVVYDEDLGYPKEVHIDYDALTTDDVDIFYIENVILL